MESIHRKYQCFFLVVAVGILIGYPIGMYIIQENLFPIKPERMCSANYKFSFEWKENGTEKEGVMEYYLETDNNKGSIMNESHTILYERDETIQINFDFLTIGRLYCLFQVEGNWPEYRVFTVTKSNAPADTNQWNITPMIYFSETPSTIMMNVFGIGGNDSLVTHQTQFTPSEEIMNQSNEFVFVNTTIPVVPFSGGYYKTLLFDFQSNDQEIRTYELYKSLSDFVFNYSEYEARYIPMIRVDFNQSIIAINEFKFSLAVERMIQHNSLYLNCEGQSLQDIAQLEITNSTYGIDRVGFGYYDFRADIFFPADVFLKIFTSRLWHGFLNWTIQTQSFANTTTGGTYE